MSIPPWERHMTAEEAVRADVEISYDMAGSVMVMSGPMTGVQIGADDVLRAYRDYVRELQQS